ncbi:hypothetical protein KKH39_04220 [Patescibacteria group bacterium]|nr:hypothetical protein [Patescibacteria group bacterium]
MNHYVYILKSKKDNWVFMWSSIPIMSNYWATSKALLYRGDIYSFGKIFCYFDGKIITAYMQESQLDKFKKEGEKYLNPHYYKKYKIKYKKESINWWKWIRKIEKIDYSKRKNSNIIIDHKKFIEYSIDSIAYFGSTRMEFTYAAEQRLKEITKKYYKDKWLDIFGILTTAVSLDDIQKENIDWLRLLSKKENDLNYLKHISKYPWLVFGQFDDNKILKFLKTRAKEEKNIFKKELNRLKKLKNDLKNQQKKIFIKFNKDSNEAKYLAIFLQNQAVERMNIKAYWSGSYYLARKMWLKIADEINIPLEDLLGFMTPLETEKLLNKQKISNIKDIVNDRKKSFALNIYSNEKLEIIGSKESRKIFNQRIKKIKNTNSLIKGQVAMHGFARGRIRKVIAGNLDMLQESIKNFKKDEILLTSMTQPNMMVVAKKAAAIIADEGGITSHAAIISRELKIPCIVGCLKAMQFFKDGDMVEVDADKGVVRKI